MQRIYIWQPWQIQLFEKTFMLIDCHEHHSWNLLQRPYLLACAWFFFALWSALWEGLKITSASSFIFWGSFWATECPIGSFATSYESPYIHFYGFGFVFSEILFSFLLIRVGEYFFECKVVRIYIYAASRPRGSEKDPLIKLIKKYLLQWKLIFWKTIVTALDRCEKLLN